MRLAKPPAPEVKAVSHLNSRELRGVDSSPLIAIHFSRLRSRAKARRRQHADRGAKRRLVSKNKEPHAAAQALFVAIDLLAFLVALLRFHRERRDGPGLEPLQRDRLAGILEAARGPAHRDALGGSAGAPR